MDETFSRETANGIIAYFEHANVPLHGLCSDTISVKYIAYIDCVKHREFQGTATINVFGKSTKVECRHYKCLNFSSVEAKSPTINLTRHKVSGTPNIFISNQFIWITGKSLRGELIALARSSPRILAKLKEVTSDAGKSCVIFD